MHQYIRPFLLSSIVNTKITSLLQYIPLSMMAQDWTESTWEIINNGKFINQFLPDIIGSKRQLEMINKKYVDKKCL